MSTDTLAARLRAALVGDYTGDVMPFDELKPEIQERWQRVADAARVPMDIEAMAKAGFAAWYGGDGAELPEQSAPVRDRWLTAIRAALAAGGLEPCADPADVAMSTPIIADLHKQLEAARREVDEVRRHISVTMSREHQARKEAQEAKRELAAMHHGETVEGVIMERDHYRIQLQHESEWVRQYKQDRDDALAELAALREITTGAAIQQMHDATCDMTRGEALGAVLDSEDAVPRWLCPECDKAVWVESYCDDYPRCSECGYTDAPGDPDPAPTDAALASEDEVEALARVMWQAGMRLIGDPPDDWTWEDAEQDAYRAEARAAIAHLRKRPAGLPTAEEIKYLPNKPKVFNNELLIAAYKALKTRHALEWDDETNKEGWQRVVDVIRNAVYDYLAPCLRQPVGWELDVTAREVEHIACEGRIGERAPAILDLCRSRIKPVFECKECAARKARDPLVESVKYWFKAEKEARERIQAEIAARAALEGE